MAEQTSIQDSQSYHGNCHCGAFQFSIKLEAPITSVAECNCSICSRKGYAWIFPPEGGLTIEKGEDILKVYEFGPKKTAHKFCSKCGTPIMAHISAMGKTAINTYTLEGIDVSSLPTPYKFDGAAIPPTYDFPVDPNPSTSAVTATSELQKIYKGACHCGALHTSFTAPLPLSDPKSEIKIQKCSCSLCKKYSSIRFIFPTPASTATPPISSTSPYTNYLPSQPAFSATKIDFCPTCGVVMSYEHDSKFGFNLLCFEGVEAELDEIYKKVENVGGEEECGLLVYS